MVGHLVDLAEQVAGHHHRHAEPAGQGADELPHLLDARRIQAVGGLVQDQQPGEAQQGGGQAQPLLHAQGVVGRPLALLAVQPDDAQHLPDVPLRRPAQGLDDVQVLRAGQVAVVAGALDQAAHLTESLHAGAGTHGPPKDGDLPCRGPGQPQKQLEGGGFARPVGAQKSIDRHLRHGEIQMVDPQSRAVLFAQPAGFHNSVHVRTPPCYTARIAPLPYIPMKPSLRLPYVFRPGRAKGKPVVV